MLITNNLLDIEDVKRSRLPLLSLFIRKTAVITSVPENLVELVVKDQWSNANKVTRADSSIAEIHFSNLGTFSVSKPKSLRKLKDLEEAVAKMSLLVETLDPNSKEYEKAKVLKEGFSDNIISLKNKNKMTDGEDKRDIGRD